MTDSARWEKRFNNFTAALNNLTAAINLSKKRELSDLEEQGLIKGFEYTYELAWKSIKDFFEFQGDTELSGSRDTIRLAFRRKLIEEGEIWMQMINSRIQTVHTYNKEVAKETATKIIKQYYPEFLKLEKNLGKHKGLS